MSTHLCLKEIRPTVFLASQDGELRQVVELVILNQGGPVEARIQLRAEPQVALYETATGQIAPGEAEYRIYVPDIREPVPAEFTLLADGDVQDRQVTTWTPQRHWSVYLVHTSHHDLGYTDLPTNVLREHDGFLDEVLGFCEETDSWPEESKFRYSIEQAWSVQHFIEHRPKKTIDRLVRLMKKGRIELTALFGNETTELCSHEELIRLMYPSFELKRRYGVPICSAEMDDIPGISWGLATVLAGAGIRYLAAGLPDYFRWGGIKVHPFWDESEVLPRDLPGAFWWEGPDKKRVLFWHCQFGGGGWSPLNYQQAFAELPGMLDTLSQREYPFEAVRYRFIGGHRDNSPPALRLSHIVKEWNSSWAYPKLMVATNSAFFQEFEKRYGKGLPVHRGELVNTDYTVGATSTAMETGINRTTHDLLGSAEKFATIAAYTADYPYPGRYLKDAYDNMLLYDEHTWGQAHPIGPAQAANWGEKANFAYRAAALADDTLSKSLNRIADHVGLPEQGYHIVVFNPLSWKRTDLARVPLKAPEPCGRPFHLDQGATPAFLTGTAIGRNIIHPPVELVEQPFHLVDLETERRMPYQRVELKDPYAPSSWAAERYALGKVNPAHLKEIVFVAEDVPPMGYKTYRLVPATAEEKFATSIKIGNETIENRFFRVGLDPETGVVVSIYDKELKRELVDSDARHNFNGFLARWAETGREESPERSEITEGETGPVYGSLVVHGDGRGCPQRTQEIILYDTIKRIDLANRLLKDSTPLLELYFAFPFGVEKPTFHFEGACSVIQPLRDQLPGSNTDAYAVQHWVDVSGDEYGVTWAAREAPVAEFGGLWPGYVSQAHHGVTPPGYGHEFLKPGELTKGHIYSYIMNNNFRTNFQPVQVADMVFRYSLSSHRGDWREGKARDFGWAVANPLAPVWIDGPREGTLSRWGSFCQAEKSNVMVLTLKKAEDGNGIIVRLIETEGNKTTTKLRLPFLEISRAMLTNLVEEDQSPLEVSDGAVEVPIEAHGIATVRVK